VLALAKRWKELVALFTGGDPEIHATLKENLAGAKPLAKAAG
jgi:hypothetical protein